MVRRVFFALLFCPILGLFPLFALADTTPQCPFSWNVNLKLGSKGGDVLKLQEFLNVTPASGYFGPVTAKAVTAFQEKYTTDILAPNALTKGTGTVGSSTRAKLNALCTAVVVGSAAISTSTPTASTIGDSLTIAAAPQQPTHTIAPANALYVPFTTITFTAGSKDVTVSQITIERVGAGSDSAFYDIGFLDPNGVEFTFGYLNAKHQVTLKDPFTIPAGTTQTYTIVGDMNVDLSNNDGEMPALQLDAVQADSPVQSFSPIRGTAQTVNASLVIGTVTATLSGDDPHGARTRYINDTGVTFSGIRISADSKEDVKLNSVTWQQSGSAAASDIANVTTVINGVSYPADLDGRDYTSVFPESILIKKGDSLDIAVKGDLTGTGSNRTVKFDLYYGADVDLTGQGYGYNINLIAGGNTGTSGNDVFLTDTGGTDGVALTPFFSGSVTTISPGGVTGIGKI